MELQGYDLRPPSMLDPPPWNREMLSGGVIAALCAHIGLPILIATVTSILAATLGNRTEPLADKHIVEAHFVQLGKKPEPHRLPQRKVPAKATAPDPATVVSKTPVDKPKPDAGVPPPERRTEDLLTRIGARAQALAEVVKDRAPEGDPQGSVEGTETEAQVGDIYLGKLVALFKRGWTIPSTLGDTSKLRVTTTFEITRDLKVGDFRIEQSSGNPLFDQSVEDRFQELRTEHVTLPAPPPEVANQFLGKTIGVRFNGEGAH